MRTIGRVLTALCGVASLATPAWAHPSTTVHVHPGDVVPLAIVTAVVGAVLLLRRARAGIREE